MKKLIKYNGSNTAYTFDEIVDYIFEKGFDIRCYAVTAYQQITGNSKVDLVPATGIITVVYNDEDEQLNKIFYKAKYLAGEGPQP